MTDPETWARTEEWRELTEPMLAAKSRAELYEASRPLAAATAEKGEEGRLAMALFRLLHGRLPS